MYIIPWITINAAFYMGKTRAEPQYSINVDIQHLYFHKHKNDIIIIISQTVNTYSLSTGRRRHVTFMAHNEPYKLTRRTTLLVLYIRMWIATCNACTLSLSVSGDAGRAGNTVNNALSYRCVYRSTAACFTGLINCLQKLHARSTSFK